MQGSSTDPVIVSHVRAAAAGKRVMVILDSDHAAAHVTAELAAYHDLVTVGCYLIVEDTNVNGHPVRPDFGAGPMEALDFVPDRPRRLRQRPEIGSGSPSRMNPRGFLRRVR